MKKNIFILLGLLGIMASISSCKENEILVDPDVSLTPVFEVTNASGGAIDSDIYSFNIYKEKPLIILYQTASLPVKYEMNQYTATENNITFSASSAIETATTVSDTDSVIVDTQYILDGMITLGLVNSADLTAGAKTTTTTYTIVSSSEDGVVYGAPQTVVDEPTDRVYSVNIETTEIYN